MLCSYHFWQWYDIIYRQWQEGDSEENLNLLHDNRIYFLQPDLIIILYLSVFCEIWNRDILNKNTRRNAYAQRSKSKVQTILPHENHAGKDRRRAQHHNAGDINRVGEIPSLSRAEKHLRRLAGSGKVRCRSHRRAGWEDVLLPCGKQAVWTAWTKTIGRFDSVIQIHNCQKIEWIDPQAGKFMQRVWSQKTAASSICVRKNQDDEWKHLL